MRRWSGGLFDEFEELQAHALQRMGLTVDDSTRQLETDLLVVLRLLIQFTHGLPYHSHVIQPAVSVTSSESMQSNE